MKANKILLPVHCFFLANDQTKKKINKKKSAILRHDSHFRRCATSSFAEMTEKRIYRWNVSWLSHSHFDKDESLDNKWMPKTFSYYSEMENKRANRKEKQKNSVFLRCVINFTLNLLFSARTWPNSFHFSIHLCSATESVPIKFCWEIIMSIKLIFTYRLQYYSLVMPFYLRWQIKWKLNENTGNQLYHRRNYSNEIYRIPFDYLSTYKSNHDINYKLQLCIELGLARIENYKFD